MSSLLRLYNGDIVKNDIQTFETGVNAQGRWVKFYDIKGVLQRIEAYGSFVTSPSTTTTVDLPIEMPDMDYQAVGSTPNLSRFVQLVKSTETQLIGAGSTTSSYASITINYHVTWIKS